MNSMKLAVPLFAALAFGPFQGVAAVPLLGPDLATFAVLGYSTVTNTGVTTITGNVGDWANPAAANAVTGFPPGQVTGTIFQGPAPGTSTQALAQSQLTLARTSLGLMGAGTLQSANLGGLTLSPGVYTVPAGATNLTGTLTLDGRGNLNAAWVFQMPSTLITSPGSIVNVINTGPGAGVYWNVGSSATLDTNTSFEGNILASASITLNNGATIVNGGALANGGAVTMDTNTISNGYRGGLAVAELGGIPSPVPEPGAFALLGFGLTGLLAFRKRSVPAA